MKHGKEFRELTERLPRVVTNETLEELIIGEINKIEAEVKSLKNIILRLEAEIKRLKDV
jgi:hypothetical protein